MRGAFLGVLPVVALVAAACARAPQPSGSAAPVALEQIPSSPREDVPSALEDPRAPGLPPPLVEVSEIIPGGPPPDGIPSIDRPRFSRASRVNWLKDRESVLALEIEGDARAYPVQILIYHEIVNDTVGGIPVAVQYCPLCNSAVAGDRRLGKRVLEFGTSGQLYRSALVMYDRQTESLWSHFTGGAIAGVLTGRKLDLVPVSTVSWSDWRSSHPDGWVLSRKTGFRRDYGSNPYVGYDRPDTDPFLFQGELDRRMPAKTRIVGIRLDDEGVAVALDLLLLRRVVETTIAGKRLVVWAKPGTASALEDVSVAGGREVGATGVFEASFEGRELHFDPVPGGFRDRESETIWDVLGHATAGPLAGKKLTPVEHVDTFWFAWAAFLPDTRIIAR